MISKRKDINHRFTSIFARLHYKINFDINNTSSFILATDLLSDSSKVQLFRIVTVNVENIFRKLVDEDIVITAKRSRAISFSLIKSVIQDFLMVHYGYKINIHSDIIKNSFYTKQVLVDQQILLSVPFHALINENAKSFRTLFFPVYNVAYFSFSEALIDNLIVEIANAVMFIILNEFSFIYEVRKCLYRANFLSLRNVERFRNNLNWQCRIKYFIKKPADLYNNQQGIWVIRTTGIYYRMIYANRSNDLMNLEHFSLLTLFTIETKDFLVSRVDEFLYFFGNSIRYILTSVIGQVIGLIWRGIIEGLKK